MSSTEGEPSGQKDQETTRRGFFQAATGMFMAGGLASGYGAFAAIAGRFLYPAQAQPSAWLFVARAADLQMGDSLVYRVPSGATVAVACQGATGEAEDYVALSSTCPHLGCKVHWESQHNRFFCPCHNGVFDSKGMGTAGPPKGQALARYPLKIENGLLFIEAPVALSAGLSASKGTLIAHARLDGSRGNLDPALDAEAS